MQKKIELSIIVPIYNVELYLEECLDSIYKIRNISKEVILINDGSIDNSLEIANKYKKKYPNITKVISQQNKGLSYARNVGLENSIGEYISFIDSDDFIEPKKFEKFYKKGKKLNLDIMVGTPIIYDNNMKCDMQRSDNIKNLTVLSGKEFLEKTIVENCYRMEVWDDIYKRDLLKKNNIYFEINLLHEDELFTPIVFFRANRVKLLKDNFYYYRQREGSITKTKTLKNIKANIYIINKLVKTHKFNIQSKILHNYLYFIYTSIISKYKICFFKEHFNIMKNMNLSIDKKIWFFKILKYIKKIKFSIGDL